MNIIEQQPLNPLQRAYLMGRNEQVPFGGVAMHDFREFYCDFSHDELEHALLKLAQHHPVLRTVIDEKTLMQQVREEVVLNVETVDLTQLSFESALEEKDRLREHYAHSRLPLDKPLWKMCLLLMPESARHHKMSAILFTSFDGLVVDGYAIAVLLNELFNDNVSSEIVAVNQEPPSYFSNLPADHQYWQEKLDDVEQVIALPWLRDLDTIFSPSYKRNGIVIPASAWLAMTALGAKHHVLPNSVLTTALVEMMALWADNDSLLFSMPVSNSILHTKLGNHSSFLAINYAVTNDNNFAKKAQALQKSVLEALSHTTYSGIELGKLLIKKTAKLVTLPVAITNGLSWGNNDYNRAEYISGLTQTPQLALDIRIRQTLSHEIAIEFDYAEQALPAVVIKQMLATLEQYLLQIAQAETLEDIHPPQYLATERRQDTGSSAQSVEPVVEDYLVKINDHLFGQDNEKTALICGDKRISYRELGQQITKIAHYFSALGVEKGDVVAICLPKSPEHIAVTLACSLANILWLPIDMDSPAERIQYMLDNCQADFVVTDRALDGEITTMDINAILEAPEPDEDIKFEPVFDAEPGYYLYTSGSTGTPKCVVMNHRATANVVEVTNKTWNLTSEDILFAVTPFHHDMSVYELFGAMSLGSSLVVPTADQTKSAMDWARLVEQHQISVWSSVPAIVDMLLACAEPPQLQSLRLISQGGDYVKPNVITKLREYLPQARLFSIGGPTETTIWSIWHEITPDDINVIPYGKAVKHNRFYIINEQGHHCPDYVAGTMVMSGVNLANGYLKDGVINQNDFDMITTPEGQRVRVFKTSDRGYFREDGEIIFSGRKEGYLKIRGVRMAAAEIELSLTQHPRIRDAIALGCVNPHYKTTELVIAYITENNQSANVSDLRQFLKNKLPSSHIPSRWLQLEIFPLSRNRKVDRKQLKMIAEQQLYQQNAS